MAKKPLRSERPIEPCPAAPASNGSHVNGRKTWTPGVEGGQEGESRRPSVASQDGQDASLLDPAVFVVDSDLATCQAVCRVAITMNLQWATYASGRQLLAAYTPSWTGCVVLELDNPEINGLEIQQALALRHSLLSVIFLTARGKVSTAVRAMRAGAIHVLEKPPGEQELWEAIQEAICLNRQNLERFAMRQQTQRLLESLHPKEHEILRLITQGKSPKEIAQELQVCSHTVKNRCNRLQQKLGTTAPAELVRMMLLGGEGEWEDLKRA